ncbi:MAG: DUF423 domain-containing protein [Alicyclobacillus sp.]|nr:DUF423 domain-containing protein [Alicyclobacillus sp.]
MVSWFVGLGGLFGFLSVAFGAFGAHVLSGRLSPDKMSVFHTAVQYQMFHALALLAIGLLYARYPSGTLVAAGWFIAAGIILFSGSLYGLSFSSVPLLGPVTPLGGVCFLVGWVCLMAFAFGTTIR